MYIVKFKSEIFPRPDKSRLGFHYIYNNRYRIFNKQTIIDKRIFIIKGNDKNYFYVPKSVLSI